MMASPYRGDDAGIEQPLRGIQIQVVRDVEVVHDERAFDRIGLYAQVEVTEGNRVCSRPGA